MRWPTSLDVALAHAGLASRSQLQLGHLLTFPAPIQGSMSCQTTIPGARLISSRRPRSLGDRANAGSLARKPVRSLCTIYSLSRQHPLQYPKIILPIAQPSSLRWFVVFSSLMDMLLCFLSIHTVIHVGCALHTTFASQVCANMEHCYRL